MHRGKRNITVLSPVTAEKDEASAALTYCRTYFCLFMAKTDTLCCPRSETSYWILASCNRYFTAPRQPDASIRLNTLPTDYARPRYVYVILHFHADSAYVPSTCHASQSSRVKYDCHRRNLLRDYWNLKYHSRRTDHQRASFISAILIIDNGELILVRSLRELILIPAQRNKKIRNDVGNAYFFCPLNCSIRFGKKQQKNKRNLPVPRGTNFNNYVAKDECIIS